MRVHVPFYCLMLLVLHPPDLLCQEQRPSLFGITANWGIGPSPALITPQPERQPGTFAGLKAVWLNTKTNLSWKLGWQRGAWTIGDNNDDLGFHQFSVEAARYFSHRKEQPFLSLGLHGTRTDAFRDEQHVLHKPETTFGVTAGAGMDVAFSRRWALTLTPVIMNWGWRNNDLKMRYWYGTIGVTWYVAAM